MRRNTPVFELAAVQDLATSRLRRLGILAGCLFLLLAWSVRVVGVGGYLVDVWDTESGLPDSSVTAIEQTPDGYLWVGTYNGLARFDGVQFEIFDPPNTTALAHPRIQDLFLDANGVLWINTYDGSLTTFESGRFRLEYRGRLSRDVRFSMVTSTADEIAFSSQIGELLRRRVGESEWQVFRPEQSPRPSSYHEDGQGQIWWHKASQGQYGRVRGGELEPVADQPPELRGAWTHCLTVDAAGELWVGTDRGLARWEAGRCDLMTPIQSASPLSVEYILPLGGGTNWVWADERLLKQTGRQWIGEITEWRGLLGTAAGRRMGMQVDREGGVWFNHYGNGVFHITPEGEPLRLTAEQGLPGNRVGAWFQDREGNIWLGVDRGGLARLRPAIFEVIAEAGGLPVRAVASVAEDSENTIWMGTFGGGAHAWRQGSLHRALNDPDAARFVFSLCEVEPGVIWMSAVDEDLYILDSRGFRRAPWDVHGVKALMKDDRGRVWAGWKEGVGYWDPRTQQAQVIQTGMEPTAVRALAATSNGVVWFGTDDGGLYRYADDSLQRFQSEDLLASQPIWALWAEEGGTVWIGTFRGGLLRFKDGVFTRYLSSVGMPSDIISQILDDGQGRLWCGSHRGIFHVSKAALNEFARQERPRVECVVYGRLDGVPSMECSGGYNPSCLRSRDGRLWFSTAKGVVSVDPDRINLSSTPPPVVLQGMRVDGVEQVLPRWGVDDPTDAGFVSIPPGRRQFRFDFAALNLSSPEKVRFRHRLIGHERDWIEVGTRREAIYSALPPGHYAFEVTARNSEGRWNPKPAIVRFDLQPFFYETWWFRWAVGILLLLAIILTVRRVVTRRLRQELALAERRHAIELDRARIARDIHDELGAGLTEIGLLSELARRDAQEATPTYLGQITEAARGLVRAMDETVWAINPENDTLEGLITYASKLAQDYLSRAGIRCRLEVPAQIPAVHLEAHVRHNLFLAIKESLNNVVRHSGATEAALRLQVAPDRFTITVEDNGCGLGPEASAVARTPEPGRLQSGHGLSNLRRRLAESGGQCAISSRPGQGTRVDLIMTTRSAGGGSRSR